MEAVSVNKLNNFNWNVWKFQIRVVLMAKGLYEITCGDESVPTTATANEVGKWKLKDAKAQEVLIVRMEEEIISYVMQCETAKEMWSKLESIFERKSEVSTHLLNEQFYNLKFENETVNSFITKVINLQAKLKQQGEDIPEKMILTKIIMSLPEKYRHFRSAWESVSSDNQTLNNLTARILIEEERLEKEESTVALMTVRQPPRSTSNKVNRELKKCFFCGKPGHFKSHCKNIECNYCKRRGHLLKDCYLKKKKEERERNQTRNGRNDNNTALITVSSDILSQINVEWYMDSGASQHMCKEKELFCNFEEFEVSKFVKIGDGTTLQALGQGNICILAYNGKNFHSVTLFDVLFVPQLKVNLFSQGKALDKSLTLVSDAKKAQFVNKENISYSDSF